tara:strand:+ start:15917 stop:18016 length:2100 start_codon:yes stop_codon:yes gene_type:complete
MANTYAFYEGNGITKRYAIPVSDWISDSHIIVQLDANGSRYDVDSVDPSYSFSISGSEIVFDVAPALDVKFIVMRDTLGKDYSDTALDYDFTDGSVVTGDQLDGVYRHALYLAQEAADLAFRKAALTDNSVLAYDFSTEQWESLPLNLNYDSTTGFFGIGGAHDAGYKYKFHGDILIEDGTGEATLRVRHTGSGGTDSATIRLEADAPTVVWEDNAGNTDEKLLHAGYTDGTLSFAFYNDAGGSSYAIPLQLTTNGSVGGVVLNSLPTSDPGVTGQLWNRNGAVVLSGAAEGRLEQLLGDVNITADDLLQGDVLHWNNTSNKWEAVPLGLVYDSTNDTFGFGGTSSSDYKFRFNGDTIIREDGTSNGAVLTIENTDVTNQQATLIVSASTPQVQFKDLNGDTDKKFFLQNYQNGVYQLVAQTDAGSAKSIIPLRLQEDGKTVLGGTSSQNADASYQHTMYGDVVIYDDTGTEATLTLQSTHSSGPDAAVLRLIADTPTVSLYDDNGATDEKTMQIGFGTGSLDFAFYPDAGGAAYAVPLQLTTDGSAGGVILNALPTTDPSVSGQLWNRNGAVVLSGSSRYIYDSGWITELTSGGTPVSLAANAIGYETLTATQNAYYPFNVTIWGRDASFPDDVYNLGASAVAQGNVTDTVGVHVRYDTSSRDLTLFLQDYAGYHEASSGLASQLPWGTIDEIRITIT